jgi:hypothetical protein
MLWPRRKHLNVIGNRFGLPFSISMYLPRLIEDTGLFKGLGGWPRTSRGASPSLLNHALFRATSILVELKRIRESEEECRRQFENVRAQLDLGESRIAFWSPSIVAIASSLSSGLASMRILQDYLPRLVGQTAGVGGVPASMNDWNRIKRSDLPAGIVDLMERYWTSNGENIKNHRDLDVHHWSVGQHCYLQLTDPPRALILLPDDPTVTRRDDQTFAGCVDGITVFQEGVVALDSLITRLCGELGGTPDTPSLAVDLDQFGDLREGTTQTVALLVDDASGMSGVVIGHNPQRQIVARKYSAADGIAPSESD